ncbi:MAG: 4-alpha-glucanotransferase [Fusobacteriaceae bacterium]|jgi:4-alpha-glucanotransferase|nr:4-alpha-glucanotransferase [Fusobacteriaceae bacterium]
MTERCGGILLHISALPGDYGIGDLGEKAYQFVDFLARAGQKIWQILPLAPPGFGNSPYQSVSVFAGNPLFIDLVEFTRKGWITEADLGKLKIENRGDKVLYDAIAADRTEILDKIYAAFLEKEKNGEEVTTINNFRTFQEENAFWLKDYALFMTLKEKFSGKSWDRWPRRYKFKGKSALRETLRENADRIRRHAFIQFVFYRQWQALKAYANEKNIRIFGDLPIYVSTDSADAWGNRSLFQFTKYGKAKRVAGCPPDYFSKTGQLWGNILYDWKAIRERRYAWWLARLSHSFRIYDLIRLDHFIGFSAYWSIPAGDPTAMYGRWEKGPGMSLFGLARKKLGSLPIVAEDLGVLSEQVRKLLRDTGFPGMKILQFAFDSPDSEYLPHRIPEKAFAYTGTHDNNTLEGWLAEAPEHVKNYAADYVRGWLNEGGTTAPLREQMICALMKSAAEAVVIPLQDYLGTGAEGRFNIPSTVGDNWSWRVEEEKLDNKLAEYIRGITLKYQR